MALEQVMVDSGIMPHSVEVEESVLGTIIADANVLNDFRDLIVPDAFYITKNKEITSAYFPFLREATMWTSSRYSTNVRRENSM